MIIKTVRSALLSTLLSMLVYVITFSISYSQENENSSGTGAGTEKHFIGSSLFVLANFLPEPPSFYQLNYGYKLSPKDNLIVEAITWEYTAPLGIPYGPSFESDDEKFPGHVRDIGVGVAYQRFFYKQFYTTLHATPFFQQYFDENNKKIQSGVQLFLSLRFGYHFRIINDRFFIEPSIAFTHWPINTNMPESFKAKENKWPNYFLFEPGLHFGMLF